MRAMTRAHASTSASSLMCVKNSTHRFCLLHFSGTLKRRKLEKEQKHQI